VEVPVAADRTVFSVFTKPWRVPLPELGRLVAGLGFEAIELPVRPGYQVEPADALKGLPAAARTLAEHGVTIDSVAGTADEPTIEACAAAGVQTIRIMARVEGGRYLESVDNTRRHFDTLLPALERHGVRIGVQNHNGANVANASGLRTLLEGYDPRQVCAVWDAAHNALQGEDPELAIDIVWSHLGLVNLKNAFWLRTNGPEAEVAQWRPYWTSGPQGLASWPRVAAELKRRGYRGTICLPAEYSDEAAVERLAAADLQFARSLFEGGPAA
jgi:sugar phosphate isomerase/epimerase